MRTNLPRSVLIVILFGLTCQGALGARESVRFVVYTNIESNYSKFMIIELRRILVHPLRRREIRLQLRELDTLDSQDIEDTDSICLLLTPSDLSDSTRAFIDAHADDPRVFVWIAGGDHPFTALPPGIDALAAPTDVWDDSVASLTDLLVPFVLERIRVSNIPRGGINR